MKIWFIVGVVIFCLIVVGFAITFIEDNKKSECLNKIADEYCQGKGMVSLGINNGQNFFKCGEDERQTWENANSYNFLKSEIENCS